MFGNDDQKVPPSPSPIASIQSPVDQSASPETPQCLGDYELLGEIARSGLVVVYKAHQISLNRTVALKGILSGQFAGESDVRRSCQANFWTTPMALAIANCTSSDLVSAFVRPLL